MAKVKICGLTNLGDAKKAEDLGADFLGFILCGESPRCISVERAKEITSNIGPVPRKVGLFMNDDINFVIDSAAYCGFDIIQLHGQESEQYVEKIKKNFSVLKSFHPGPGFDFNILKRYVMSDFFLFDKYKKGIPGGTGETFDWSMLYGRTFDKPIFLAGGLNKENVKNAVQKVNPFCVDVSSGVESVKGKKDHGLMEDFINAAG